MLVCVPFGLAAEEQDHLLDYAVERMAVRRPLDAFRPQAKIPAQADGDRWRVLNRSVPGTPTVPGATLAAIYAPAVLNGTKITL